MDKLPGPFLRTRLSNKKRRADKISAGAVSGIQAYVIFLGDYIVFCSAMRFGAFGLFSGGFGLLLGGQKGAAE